MRVPTSAQIIIVRAFLVFSSSPEDIKYIIPPYITASTANTATYWIKSAITLQIIPYIPSSDGVPSQPGSHPHSIFGISAPKSTAGISVTIIMQRKNFIYLRVKKKGK